MEKNKNTVSKTRIILTIVLVIVLLVLRPFISTQLARLKLNHAARNATPELKGLVGHSFFGYYEPCSNIKLSFTSPCDVVADLWSTDWVGRGSWKVKGHYSFHDPFVLIEWKNEDEYPGSMIMDYLIFDKELGEMIIYAPNGIYYLNHKGTDSELWAPFPDGNDIDISLVPYAMIEKDNVINDYFTHRDFLHFTNGYEITYDEILSNIMQSRRFSKTEHWMPVPWSYIKYEDDSLLVYFKNFTVQQPHGKVEARIPYYSVRPLAAFDKRIPVDVSEVYDK